MCRPAAWVRRRRPGPGLRLSESDAGGRPGRHPARDCQAAEGLSRAAGGCQSRRRQPFKLAGPGAARARAGGPGAGRTGSPGDSESEVRRVRATWAGRASVAARWRPRRPGPCQLETGPCQWPGRGYHDQRWPPGRPPGPDSPANITRTSLRSSWSSRASWEFAAEVVMG